MDDFHFNESLILTFGHRHKGKLKSPAVQRYLHELMVDVGEHLSSVSTALSMFIEVGQSPHLHGHGVALRLTLDPRSRYSNYPFRTTTRGEQFFESLDDRDILLCRHGDNPTILVPKCWHRSCRRCQWILVYVPGIQHCGSRQ